MKKYELTDETIYFDERTLYRIRALYDFGTVKAGDLGGYIEHEGNLSHEGDCWVADQAKVCGKACVSDNAFICDQAAVDGSVRVSGNAVLCNYAFVDDSASIFGNAIISGSAAVHDFAAILDNAIIKEHAIVSGNAIIRGHATISGDAIICDNATVCGSANVGDFVNVRDSAIICGNSILRNHAEVGGQALISSGHVEKVFHLQFNGILFTIYDRYIQIGDCWHTTLAEFMTPGFTIDEDIAEDHEKYSIYRDYYQAIKALIANLKLYEIE